MKENSSNNYFSRYGEEFCRRFIVALLNDRIFFERIIDIVKPKYFDNNVYQWVIKKVQEIYIERKIVPIYNDLEILADEEKSNDIFYTQLITELENIKSLQLNINLSIVKDKALEFCKNQEMKTAILKSVERLKQNDYDSIRQIMDIALKAGADKLLGHDYFDDIDLRMKNFRENVVATDWEILNKVMNGGLAAGELGVVLAGTNVGKSVGLCNIGVGALRRGKMVLHYTFEMSAAMIGLKYDSRITNIPLDDISSNVDEVKELLGVFKEKTNSKLIVQQYPTKAPTILNIRSHIQQVMNKGYIPDLIIFDYADLIKVDIKNRERRHELEEIYEQLRGLGGEIGCAVWTASQVNRSNFAEEIIEMTGFAESWAKAHVSDFVLSVSRDTKSPIQTVGTAFVAKNRIGPQGGIFSIDVDMSRAYMWLKEYNDNMMSKKKIDKIFNTILNTDPTSEENTKRTLLADKYKEYKEKGQMEER